MPQIGMTEVAARAGVSVTTVSHVLSGRRPVAERTRARVLEVIDELGYQPNSLAQGLRTRRTMTVGLIVPDLTNPFYPMVLRGLDDVLVPAGYRTVVCNTDGSREQETLFLRDMATRRVDGVVIAPFQLARKDLLAHRRLMPLVRLGGALPFDADLGDLIRSDDEGGMAQAVRYLLEQGRHRVAYIGGARHAGPSDRREAGFRRAINEVEHVVDEDLVVRGEFTRDAGREAAEALLDRDDRPDAIACANDLIAIGVLDAARKRGLRVPEDLAVTGYDDIDAASLVHPALTTVVNPAREVGRACGQALLRQLTAEEAEAAEPSHELVIANTLVRRESA
ncbi:LacI family DNA-binding transcriptional regulator [Streptomyces spinoverrucosus]|uniref:LacI family DNA-binding transcriptional regulator n=1 Tax=Streptomyces spinoverrucosus TaxID=284043 RepID=UPI0018C3B9D9|nr:LacI family DNA-binding transcriptional regulator [Streptomyces spinoverrucosus]MBG0851383.1 LacI family DNA-binding transcriptional regulator [Streptomyces spinoverrucosus]